MTRPCQVCRHDRVDQINLALVAGLSHRTIGERFDVSEDSVQRHATRHLTPQLAAAIALARSPTDVDIEALTRSESESLLGSLVVQRARLSEYSAVALKADPPDVKTAVRCENAVLANLEATAKLVGRWVHVHEHRSINLTITPEYLQLRRALVDVLRPHPDVARKVAAALAQIEGNAAADMTRAGKPIPASALLAHASAPA